MYCFVCGENDHVAQMCQHGCMETADFGTTTQVVGTIEDKPVLPPECKIETPVDAELAWKELQRTCRGF